MSLQSQKTHAQRTVDAWSRYQKTQIFRRGLDFLKYVEQHRDDRGFFPRRLPFLVDGVHKLFAIPPRPADFIDALIDYRELVIYNSNISAGEDEASIGWLLQEMSYAKLDDQYQALLAIVDFLDAPGQCLVRCKPRATATDDFPRARLSPYAFQAFTTPQLILNAGGSMSETHIDFGTVSGFSTVVEGEKIFVSWPPTANNLRMFQGHHLFSNSWDSAFETLQKLEQPHVNHVGAGQTLYLPAGELHVVFSPTSAFLHSVFVVNPTVEE